MFLFAPPARRFWVYNDTFQRNGPRLFFKNKNDFVLAFHFLKGCVCIPLPEGFPTKLCSLLRHVFVD